MKNLSRHPFLTFVLSGFIAFVLIGGALATISGVQQPQTTTSKAYMSR